MNTIFVLCFYGLDKLQFSSVYCHFLKHDYALIFMVYTKHNCPLYIMIYIEYLHLYRNLLKMFLLSSFFVLWVVQKPLYKCVFLSKIWSNNTLLLRKFFGYRGYKKHTDNNLLLLNWKHSIFT